MEQSSSWLNLKRIILENTFINLASMVDETYWIFRMLRPLILSNYWPSNNRIENTTTQILFISASASDTNDDMHQLRDLAKQSIYTDFLEVPWGNKNDIWKVVVKNYMFSIDNFIIKTSKIVNIPLPSAPTTSNSTNTTANTGTTSTNTTFARTTISW